jgi:putative endonuclease
MQHNTVSIGKNAETLAEEYIKDKKFKIIKKNFKFGKTGEIDIIAYDGDILVFLEIRSKASKEYGDPISSITPGKIKKIRKTAEGYLYVNNISNTEIRFDVITVDFTGEMPKLDYIPYAF